MILEVIKNKYGIGLTARIKCDKCGKEFSKGYSLAKKRTHHYCNRGCAGLGSEGSPEYCMVCGKPRDNNFYDKSAYRPLCSKQCYSDFIDSIPKDRYTGKVEAGQNWQDKPVQFYKQGRLIANYNLGVF